MQEPNQKESTLRTVVRVAVNTCVLFFVLVSSAIVDRLKQWLKTSFPGAGKNTSDITRDAEPLHSTDSTDSAGEAADEVVFDGLELARKPAQKKGGTAKIPGRFDKVD